jgi:ParB/RepB/Spo0J family partition protein
MADGKLNTVSKETNFRIDPAKIEIEKGFNLRPIDREHVDSFKSSIKAGAEIPQMVVRVEAGKVILVDGHHRHVAYTELRTEGTPIESVAVRQTRANDAERVASILTSAQGKPLSPLEAGEGYKRLLAYGWDMSKIVSFVGKSATAIKNALMLIETDSSVQKAIKEKKVSSTQVLDTIKRSPGKVAKVVEEAIKVAETKGKKSKKATAKDFEEKVATPKPVPTSGAVKTIAGWVTDAEIIDWCEGHISPLRAFLGTMPQRKTIRDFVIDEINKGKK